MRRIVALLLVIALLLSGCSGRTPENKTLSNSPSPTVENNHPSVTEEVLVSPTPAESIELTSMNDEMVSFSRMDDPAYMAYVQDMVYAGLVDQFDSEDYIIENISAVYLSKEYLEEVAYNSQSNIWFGYTIAEVREAFGDTPYVFTLGEEGKTIVVPFQSYDDTYERAIKNVVTGTGVILLCATVSIISGGVGAAPVSMIFAASAKTGTSVAVSWGAISGLIAGTIEGVKSKDFNKTLKAGALAASDSFKWGAIVGAVVGGTGAALKMRGGMQTSEAPALSSTPEYRKAELRALDKYGGEGQATYLAGEKVAWGTPGATRPDVVRTVGNHLEAIEVKYYKLDGAANLNVMRKELVREVGDRIANMPAGTTQRIVLDVTGRGYSESLVKNVAASVKEWLEPIYHDIPVVIEGL